MVRVNTYDVDFGTVRLRKTDPLSTVNRVSGTVSFDWTVDDDYEEERDSVSVEWSANGTTWNSMGGSTVIHRLALPGRSGRLICPLRRSACRRSLHHYVLGLGMGTTAIWTICGLV